MANWFETGPQGVEREKLDREKKRLTPWRFFLKVGQTSRIVFLDDFTRTRAVELPGSGEVVKQPIVPFCINEHNLTIDGDWKNWLTCVAKITPPCPICSAGHYKYYIGMYTVLASYEDASGVEKWSKKLFAAKIDGIERIRIKQAQYAKDGRIPDKQFQHCMFHVSRAGERSVVTGDDLEFIKKMSRDEVAALLPAPQQGQDAITVDPYNYEQLLTPKSRDELDTLLKSGRVAPPRAKQGAFDGKTSGFSGKAVVGAASGDAGNAKSGDSPADAIDF
jgi:hypothetical protein